MPQYIDIKGQRFGLLTVVSREQSKNEKAMWLCQCDFTNSLFLNHYAEVIGNRFDTPELLTAERIGENEN